MVPHSVGADPGRLVALVRGLEVPLARELVVLGLDLAKDGVLVRPPDADLREACKKEKPVVPSIFIATTLPVICWVQVREATCHGAVRWRVSQTEQS